MAPGGTNTNLPDRAGLESLRAGLRGALLFPGDDEYEQARSVWNGMIDRRPAAIARCLGVVDVLKCVSFARERSLPLSVRGGGHNIAGLAVCEGGLMLDMSLMRGVWVDPSARVAHAQAGCLLGDVDRETQLHGLAAVLGFVSKTGVAGLTTGGGFGYLTRRFGWTCDNVRAMEVVTADGSVVRASEKKNEDLFWALRGGGGNFGVVTKFEFNLFPVGPEVVAGMIAWPADRAPEVLALYRRLAEEAPPECAVVALMRNAPPAPWLRNDIHGKPIIALVVCDTGEISDAEKRIAPLKAFGSPVGDILQRRPYAEQQSLLDATQPAGRRYYWKSEYLPRVGEKLFELCAAHAGRMVSPFSAIVIFPLGGSLHLLPDDHSPAGNRDAAFVLNVMSSWEKPEDDGKNIDWARTAWREMRGLSTGGTYLNFLTEDETDERTRAAYGKNFERLSVIKSRWDPGNFFHVNKNILPRSDR